MGQEKQTTCSIPSGGTAAFQTAVFRGREFLPAATPGLKPGPIHGKPLRGCPFGKGADATMRTLPSLEKSRRIFTEIKELVLFPENLMQVSFLNAQSLVNMLVADVNN